ncbi:pyoverdine/dityrosine biosynthesis protein [Beauveria bassiana ARSEF 2860]|uniref:Pyoverdine/dityrosine biosynthesis protein n=1 Tax=Beauveria bassiana (strain ARSEF 2860) TaxID=655819 RepID=J5JC08_BEAB2|nr:pyoverdine/dityrosine biosynthesis protein [Beauveria bassiana ARSEF 2860]EJP61451.1 pyoverdine/dityrosine biosynthesis protein [Beauveria bassiana ARSEF 2860]
MTADKKPATAMTSAHARYAGGFIRTSTGSLIYDFGPARGLITSQWAQIAGQLMKSRAPSDVSLKPSGLDIELKSSVRESDTSRYLVYEVRHCDKLHIVGYLQQARLGDVDQAKYAFDSFLASLVLSSIRVDGNVDHDIFTKLNAERITDAVISLFEVTLQHKSKYDKWHAGGRDVFRRCVDGFTSRGKMIEFCLPAFPCKSSNTQKVLSDVPDRGEYLALTNLHNFLREIENIYSPGAKLWIISDGHVFSDCIGVDDDDVDAYGEQLMKMNHNIAQKLGGQNRIEFQSLIDIFAAASFDLQRELDTHRRAYPEFLLQRHLPTNTTDIADTCRSVLMLGFGPDQSQLRNELDSHDAGMTALYRGFSKFMLEDLIRNKYTKHLSRTQVRKIAARVAFEMIQRNQAYSNLVEAVFPRHIRLSIHAHDNSGPKFGVNLLGRNAKATDTLPLVLEHQDGGDILHVPTPWHNCVVQIDGHPSVIVTKSNIVREALASGKFRGGIVDSPVEGLYAHITPQ